MLQRDTRQLAAPLEKLWTDLLPASHRNNKARINRALSVKLLVNQASAGERGLR